MFFNADNTLPQIVAEKQCVSYPKFDEGGFNKCGSRKLEKGLFLQLEGSK